MPTACCEAAHNLALHVERNSYAAGRPCSLDCLLSLPDLLLLHRPRPLALFISYQVCSIEYPCVLSMMRRTLIETVLHMTM